MDMKIQNQPNQHNHNHSLSKHRLVTHTSNNTNIENIFTNNNDNSKQITNKLADNPFWIPGKNSALFELREIKKKEQEIKRMIKRNKSAAIKDTLESIKNEGKYKLNNIPFLQTEVNITIPEKRETTAFRLNQTTGNNDSQYLNKDYNIEILKNLDNLKNRKQYENHEDIEKTNIILKDKIQRISSKKTSIRDFIQETRDFIQMKYSIAVKQERKKRLEETYANELESIKDTIISMKNAKMLFEEKFLTTFDDYCKFCVNSREKEKGELNKKTDLKKEKDIKIKELENKKTKQIEKIKKYEEYRNFLICIKEKLLMNQLEEVLKNKDNDVFITESSQMITAKRSKNTRLSFLKSQNDHSTLAEALLKKKSAFDISSSRLIDYDPSALLKSDEQRKRIYAYLKFNQPIFNSYLELTDELKLMEKENINRLEKYNKITNNLQEIDKEYTKLKIIHEKDSNLMNENLMTMENKVEELKGKREHLINLKKSLLNKDNKENKSQSTTDLPVVYHKIESLFIMCQISIAKIIEKKKENMIDKDKDVVGKMQLVEKCLNFLNEKYEIYRGNREFKERLKKKHSELEEDKKKRASEKQNLLNKQKLEKLKKSIIEKNQRIFVRNKREITKKFKPKEEDIQQSESINENNGQLTFEELISYDDEKVISGKK